MCKVKHLVACYEALAERYDELSKEHTALIKKRNELLLQVYSDSNELRRVKMELVIYKEGKKCSNCKTCYAGWAASYPRPSRYKCHTCTRNEEYAESRRVLAIHPNHYDHKPRDNSQDTDNWKIEFPYEYWSDIE